MEMSSFEASIAGLFHDLRQYDQRFEAFVPQALRAEAALLQLADRLSVGDAKADPRQPSQAAQLGSIFCQIELNENGRVLKPAQDAYWPLQPLRAARVDTLVYPADPLPVKEAVAGRKVLLDALFEQMQRAQAAAGENKPVFIESSLGLIQQYGWCLPSACHPHLAGVGLYDHSRVTAALAVCLSRQPEGQTQRWFKGEDREKPVCLLVGGDISGIQSFIYTITSKGAASALRGRSLYLQYLTDAVMRFVLDSLELPFTNVLYAGGGHFYLLAPADAAEKIAQTQREVSKILLGAHHGDLYLALEQTPIAAGSFHGKALSDCWRQLSQRLRTCKLRKFSEMDTALFDALFASRPDKGNQEKECAVCGREDEHTSGEGDAKRCPQCSDFERLGKDLRRAAYLEITRLATQPFEQDRPFDLIDSITGAFGYRYRLCADETELPDISTNENVLLYALDERDAGNKPVFGRKFLVNVTPLIDTSDELTALKKAGVEDLPDEKDVRAGGAVKPFTALEHHAGSGFKRLGVLRMDVDNMGELVSEGLGEQANLTRQAGLSFLINLFFEGYSAVLARQYNRPASSTPDRVYSIYSGGDDLFFVGAWDAMPALALEMRNALRKFTAQHPGIHASAGIALVGGKYPLYQAADDAEAALGRAKARPGKNSIDFLSQTLAWQDFAENVQPWFEKLRVMTEKKKIARQVLQRLIRYQLQFEEKRDARRNEGEELNKENQERKLWGPWNWQAAYELRKNDKKEEPSEMIELRKEILEKSFDSIEWIGLAARWADLQTR